MNIEQLISQLEQPFDDSLGLLIKKEDCAQLAAILRAGQQMRDFTENSYEHAKAVKAWDKAVSE